MVTDFGAITKNAGEHARGEERKEGDTTLVLVVLSEKPVSRVEVYKWRFGMPVQTGDLASVSNSKQSELLHIFKEAEVVAVVCVFRLVLRGNSRVIRSSVTLKLSLAVSERSIREILSAVTTDSDMMTTMGVSSLHKRWSVATSAAARSDLPACMRSSKSDQ